MSYQGGTLLVLNQGRLLQLRWQGTVSYIIHCTHAGDVCLRNSVSRISSVPIQNNYLYFIPYKVNFLRKITSQSELIFLHSVFSKISSLSYFAHFHDFQLFSHPQHNFLQRVDLPTRVHVAPAHVRNLPVFSLLCTILLLFVLFYLPSVTCNFTV